MDYKKSFLTSALVMGMVVPFGTTRADVAGDCVSGQYFDENSSTCVGCPTGYGSSDAGVTGQNSCYRDCTTGDVAQSTAVSGRYYYGDNNQCEATACATNWNVFDFETGTLSKITDGYTGGFIIARTGSYYNYIGNISSHPVEYYGLTELGSWAIESIGGGIVYGTSVCKNTSGNNSSNTWSNDSSNWLRDPNNFSLTNTGRYCWCKVLGEKANDVSMINNLNTAWVFRYAHNTDAGCLSSCAEYCASGFGYYTNFRNALLGSVGDVPARCEADIYTVNAGEYLDKTTQNNVTCPAGSYCPGGGFFYYEDSVMSCPDGFTSDEGTSDINKCYRSCTINDKEYSLSVTGTYYYGENKCSPTSCATGWHVFSGLKDEYDSLHPTNYTYGYINESGGWNEYVSNDTLSRKGRDYYGLSENLMWAVDFDGWATVRGRAVVSSTSGSRGSTADSISSSSGGRYCWCQMTGYKANNDNQWTDVSSVYVMSDSYSWSSYGASSCAYECAWITGWPTKAGYNYEFVRDTLFNSVGLPDHCEANKYNCSAGNYLDSQLASCVECPDNSYCAGGNFVYNATNLGINGSCPSEYPFSNAGTTSIKDCYRDCKSTDALDALLVSGKYFYNDNNKCEVQCAIGWGVKQDMTLYQMVVSEVTNSAIGFISASGNYGTGGSAYSYGQSYYGLTDVDTWFNDGGFGIFYGKSNCNSTSGTNGSVVLDDVFDISSTGANCWCNLQGYKSNISSDLQVIESNWTYLYTYDNESNCGYYCSHSCADGFSSSSFRSLLIPNATKEKVCEIKKYSCAAGTYVSAETGNCESCPSGSYCAGGDFTYTGSDQGLITCPFEYPLSDSASSINDCYRDCTTGDVAGAASVSGKYYYGNNNQCEPTTCAKGYTKTELANLVPYITLENIKNNNYCASGIYKSCSGGGFDGYSNITESNTWGADQGFGIFYGDASCNDISGSMDSDGDHRSVSSADSMSRDTSGQYCWCQLNAYQNSINDEIHSVLSSWVYADTFSDQERCSYNCAINCAQLLRFYSDSMFYQGFRYQLFKTASVPDVCEINTYSCVAGTYVSAETGNCESCPSGSYCVGGDFTYNGNDQGITGSCPSDYPLSNSAVSINDCYRDCTTDDVAGAATVSGKYYYGNNNQCEPTACVKGWHKQEAVNVSVFDKDKEGNSVGYISNNGSFIDGDIDDLENGEYKVSFDYGILYGSGKCTTTSGSWLETATDLNETEGGNCWCNITGYKADANSALQSLSSSWVFFSDNSSIDGCTYNCSNNLCSAHIKSDYLYRSALIDAISSKSSCQINTYSCAAGTYLDNTTETCVACPVGSYCPGGDFTYNGNDQGKYDCPGINTSDKGAASETQCYTANTVSCASINPYNSANPDAVVNVYYGNSDNGTAPCKTYYGNDSCDVGDKCDITSVTCANGFGTQYAEGSLNLLSRYNAVSPSAFTYASLTWNVGYEEYTAGSGITTKGQVFYGLSENGTWATSFDEFGSVRGNAVCTSTVGTNGYGFANPDVVASVSKESGGNCWCNLSGYRQNDISEWTDIKSDYVFRSSYNSTFVCTDICAFMCALDTGSDTGLRDNLFNSVKQGLSCAANTINIEWYDNGNMTVQNTCTYGQSDIVLPVPPAPREGFLFRGWRLVEE